MTKHVTYHGGGETSPSMITAYAGVDSMVIYRINASGPGFFLSLDLASSTVYGMKGLDPRAPANVTSGFVRPSEADFTERGTPGVVSAGYWDLPKGTVFNHALEGDGARFYLFNEESLERMEHGAVLEYDPDMTLTSGNGTRSAVMDGGRYVAVIDLSAAAEGSWQRFELTSPS